MITKQFYIYRLTNLWQICFFYSTIRLAQNQGKELSFCVFYVSFAEFWYTLFMLRYIINKIILPTALIVEFRTADVIISDYFLCKIGNILVPTGKRPTVFTLQVFFVAKTGDQHDQGRYHSDLHGGSVQLRHVAGECDCQRRTCKPGANSEETDWKLDIERLKLT